VTTQTTTTPTQRWVLALSSLASFIVILDLLVVATALSTIQRGLGASLVDLEWTVNSYTLSFAVFMMTAATLGSRFGRRRVFAAGLALFGLASAACALAPDVAVLVAARAVQGLGAAAVMPMALALLNAAFPPARRGWATGVYGSVTGLAAVLGPVFGGLVAQGLSWQWIFWLNVPIVALAIPLVLTRMPEGYGPAVPVDLPGLVLAALGALGLVWGLVRANGSGWGSPSVLVLLVGGALVTIAFVGWERRARVPMLPLRLFGSREFSAGNAVIFLLNGALTAAVFFTAQYLQVSLGHGALAAGLRLLPWGIAPLLVAPRAGALADRFGERVLVVVGMILFTVGVGWLALVATSHATYLSMVVPMSVAGVGFALAIPAATKAVVSSVALPDIGPASGTYSTVRQLGGAFGVAVVGAVFAATGGFGSAGAFSDGYRAALGACAALTVAGAGAGLALSRRPAAAPDPRSPASTARAR
jgi:EmrB/QacA subfamily drug resistance transporter